MRSTKKIWLGIGALVGLLAVGQVAAQVAQDFPNLKGGNARTGRNGDPGGSGPGPANLRWYATNAAGSDQTRLTVDNTDTTPPYVHPVYGAYQTNPTGFTASTAGWNIATGAFSNTEAAAEDAYVPSVRLRAEGGQPRNSNLRSQYYLYAPVTNSRLGGPQTQADNPADLRTFTWNLTPPTNTSAGQYALYVHLPIQPTLTGGTRFFPQRYYVYQITFGGNQTRTEIVDTYASGGGWVRLGAGGQPTSAVFGYDGTNPIRIQLFNTVPRNDQGQLMLPNGMTSSAGLQTYADAAMAVPQPGNYVATPTSARLVDGDLNSTVVTGASNERETGLDVETGDATSSTNSIVTNYDYQNGNVRWRYSPSAETGAAVLQDDDQAVLAGAGAWAEDPALPHISGDGARTAPVQLDTNTGLWSDATYTFNVPASGSYAVYAYIPPTAAATPLAHGARYEILTTEFDGTTTTNLVTVDQSANQGWVRLGARFAHDTYQRQPTDTARPIRVRVTNFSADPTDGARSVYIDAIRVVGESSLAVTSSPVHANALVRIGVGTDPVERKVVFIADESGRIHCLDATGNGDGTTRVYWTYPSVRDSAGYDPNLGTITGGSNVVAGEDWSGPGNTPPADRSPTADMPRGFELSTASIERSTVAGELRDFLYIAASNGRVYCIDVAGRGDNTGAADTQSGALRNIGTTTRAWTYPNTYPSPNEVATSSLGPFRGSVVVSNGVVYASAPQGRIYAMNAVGNANRTTTVNWTFPALNEPTLGAIQGTPSLEFGRLYFGTMRKLSATEDIPGRVIALNLDGTQAWSFQRTGFEAPAPVAPDIAGRTDDFRSSVITVPGSQLGGGDPNTVFALNENRVLYAFNADTGAVNWANNELQTGATGSLGFTQMLAFDNTGTQSTVAPVVLVPGANGQFSALFANQANINLAGGRLAWGYVAAGERIDASMSVSNGWMYGADSRGYLYAWSTGLGISIPGGDAGPVFPPNDPRGNLMRKSKIKIIDRDLYRRLRQPEDAASADRATYAAATAGGVDGNKVFEWGETAYVLVYDFPYLIEDPDGNPVDPPIVNISFNADGRTVRGVSVQSRRFLPGEGAPLFEDVAPTGPMPGVTSNPSMDGYAVLAFPLQNGGANAVPPGAGEISFNIQTAGLASGGALATIAVSPNVAPVANQAWSRIPFRVANPLGIVVPNQADVFPGPGGAFGLGMTNNPAANTSAAERNAREEALMNGSIENPGTAKLESKLTTATPVTNHGSTGKTKVWIYDRSFMGLLRPGGRFGLDNVRMDRRDLARQGGERAVFKRFDPTVYAGFEDLPLNYPNTSVDYPDLRSEQIRIVKDPNGSAENPIFSGVALLAPTGPGGLPLTEGLAPSLRTFVPTEFEIDVEVPRFQPPASSELLQAVTDGHVLGSNGAPYRQGHIGRIQVFVDSLSNGQLDMAQREAYRSFNLTTSIAIDERLRVTTPTIDFGTLPTGTGFSPQENRPGLNFNPANPLVNSQGLMHPWSGSAFAGAYKEFGVVNEGNVNLLSLRAATATTINVPRSLPLTIDAAGNDPLSWMNGFWNIHTSLDYRYSSGPNAIGRPIAVQKPRVSDRLPTSVLANTKRRLNVNLGVGEVLYNMTADAGDPTGLRFPDSRPKVGVSVPIGFPAGKYSTRLVIIEDTMIGVQNRVPSDPNYGNTPLTTGGGESPVYGNMSTLAGGVWEPRPRMRFGAGPLLVIPGETPEPGTEPGILLSFNVAESRLTNTYTPLTAPMVDNLAATGGDLNLRFQNTQPAATRDANGNLIVAWTSNRTAFGNTPAANGTDFTRNATRLYFASLDSGASFTGTGYSVVHEPANQGSFLRDLGKWNQASAGQWFRQAAGNYPGGSAATYFGAGAVESSARYGSPSFPTGGYLNPFGTGGFTNAKLAFVGRADRATASGTVEESRLMVTSVTANANGVLAAPEPIVMPFDTQVAKTEPSVLQTSNTDAIVLYTGMAAGQSWGYYTRVEGSGFRPVSALPFGQGFLSTGGVSATGRTYTGARVDGAPASRPVAEVVFTGLLRGRPYSETFLARANMMLSAGNTPVVPMRFAEKPDGTLQDQIFEYLPAQNEQVTRESASLFRTRGVAWQRDAGITLYQRVNNVTNDLLVPNTRTADRETGLISYESRLGGRVVFDPAQGTIRFTAAAPTGSAQIFATYTPRFLRISNARVTNSANPLNDQNSGASTQGGGASKTTAMFDQRFISDTQYWRRGNGNFVAAEPIVNDRLVVTWNRAAGSGATARPFLSSLRFGVDLTYRLPTLPDGTPGYFAANGTAQPAVTGVYIRTGPGSREPVDAYQMDPANGRIYLPAAYEGYTVEVDFVGVDDSGTLIPVSEYPVIATYVTERAPEPLPIETAVNESGLTAFLDPFSYLNDRRPPLVWLFWTSTRGGVPDIYFETLAPQWTPTVIAK